MLAAATIPRSRLPRLSAIGAQLLQGEAGRQEGQCCTFKKSPPFQPRFFQFSKPRQWRVQVSQLLRYKSPQVCKTLQLVRKLMVKCYVFIKANTQRLKGHAFIFVMVIMDTFEFSVESGIILIRFIDVFKRAAQLLGLFYCGRQKYNWFFKKVCAFVAKYFSDTCCGDPLLLCIFLQGARPCSCPPSAWV